jgi:DNA relaxase NicK
MIVDWLSFTLPIEPTTNDLEASNRSLAALRDYVAPFAEWCYQQDTKATTARRPYCNAIRWGDATLYSGIGIDHCLTEVSGKGCESLRAEGLLEGLLKTVESAVTRIDIAYDILGITPDEIVAEGYSDRFRTHSRISSDTGVTHYVGSVKSERYCRVYRYAPPHPRSNLTRIEVVHRKRYAKILLAAINDTGLNEAGLAALSSYGFKHEAIPKSAGDILATVAIIKGNQKTLRWIIAQVAPAFKRLVKDGTITNPDKFLHDYFLASSQEYPPSL